MAEHENGNQNQNHAGNGTDKLRSIALLGDYLPRRCGIATFTADLAESLAKAAPDARVWTVSMNDKLEGYRYPPRVWFEVNENRLGEYRLAADFLNMSKADVVCLQHEYGIFGGEEGEYIIDLVRRLRMPVVTTCHTVLNDPTDKQKQVMGRLNEVTDRFVVMADRAVEFLVDIYGIPREKVQLIGHGIPDVPFVDPNYYKDQFGVEGKRLILTFGLLSPNKGIETMIDALPAIVEKFPDVVYMVLGATHPGVVADSGEEYRVGLKRRAKDLGVEDHIQWYNKFVETDELVEFLGAADVYVTPYLNEAQITSGTLAYALGAGKATVSTPYWHAQELLADDRGKLVPFKDTQAMAEAVIDLFDNEPKRHAMRKRAYQYTRPMKWSETAKRYLELFNTVREERRHNPKPAAKARAATSKREELAEIKLDHLRMLTDDAGTFRFARNTVPERRHGYTTDDNARALVAVLIAQDHIPARSRYAPGPHTAELVGRYLAFLDHAFDSHSGRFYNHLGFDRSWHDDDDDENPQLSEDAHGRAVWALGETVDRAHQRGHMTVGANLFQQALTATEEFQTLHGLAFTLIGIHAYLRRFSGDSHARRIRETLAERLAERFDQNIGDGWWFPLNQLTYASARIPHALLLSGRWMFDNRKIETALHCLNWLHDIQVNERGQFAPIGSDHPFERGGDKPRFVQKPIEASASIDAYLEAHRVTADGKWLDYADTCLNWFMGDNDLNTPLYDPTTGGAYDALAPHGVNENQGGEATIAWLLSLLSLYDHSLESENSSRSPKEPTPEKSEPETPDSADEGAVDAGAGEPAEATASNSSPASPASTSTNGDTKPRSNHSARQAAQARAKRRQPPASSTSSK